MYLHIYYARKPNHTLYSGWVQGVIIFEQSTIFYILKYQTKIGSMYNYYFFYENEKRVLKFSRSLFVVL